MLWGTGSINRSRDCHPIVTVTLSPLGISNPPSTILGRERPFHCALTPNQQRTVRPAYISFLAASLRHTAVSMGNGPLANMAVITLLALFVSQQTPHQVAPHCYCAIYKTPYVVGIQCVHPSPCFAGALLCVPFLCHSRHKSLLAKPCQLQQIFRHCRQSTVPASARRTHPNHSSTGTYSSSQYRKC